MVKIFTHNITLAKAHKQINSRRKHKNYQQCLSETTIKQQYYTVGHKKRATLFWATTSMFLYEF